MKFTRKKIIVLATIWAVTLSGTCFFGVLQAKSRAVRVVESQYHYSLSNPTASFSREGVVVDFDYAAENASYEAVVRSGKLVGLKHLPARR